MNQAQYLTQYEQPQDTEAQIIHADLPQHVDIVLQQSIGAGASPLVQIGDTVQEGTLIGAGSGAFSLQAHASIQGVIQEITATRTFQGIPTQRIRIGLSKQFHGTIGAGIYKHANWESLDTESIMIQLYNAGLVDIAEYTIPLYIKLQAARLQKISTLIINGIFPEATFNGSWSLLLQYEEEIIEGTRILQKLLGAETIILALPKTKHHKLTALTRRFSTHNIQLQTYPPHTAYTEKILIKQVHGANISQRTLAIHAGIYVTHIRCVYNIYQAMTLKRPMTRQILSIWHLESGKTFHYQARIGTSLRYILEECEMWRPDNEIILGGLMRGYYAGTEDYPITKDLHTIVLTPRITEETPPEIPCIRCGFCIERCPVGLNPIELYQQLQSEDTQQRDSEALLQCIGCGHCSFICPSRIPLMSKFLEAQQSLQKDIYLHK